MSDTSLRDVVRDAVLAIFPWLVLSGLHTYRVARVNADGSVDLEPPAGVIGPPSWPRVGQWSAGGYEATPAVGGEVLIVYRDNDVKRPAIVSFTPLRTSKPSSVRIDVAGAGKVTVGDPDGSPKAVARVDDTVSGGTLSIAGIAGAPVLTWIPPGGGTPIVSPPALSIPLAGVISSGSPKLESE